MSSQREYEPTANLVREARESLYLGADLSTPTLYKSYFEECVSSRFVEGLPLPHKAAAQFILFPLGLSEDTTRVVDARDLPTLYRYFKHLLDTGRSKIWISTCIENDINNPSSNPRKEHAILRNDPRPVRPKGEPPAGLNSLDDLDAVMPSLLEFRTRHPELLYKIFPQDRNNPNSVKILAVDNPSERRLILTVRPGENTSSDRTSSDAPAKVLNIDLNGPIPVIQVERREDLGWIHMLINSHEMLKKLDSANFIGSSFIDVEGLFFQSGHHKYKLSLIQDVIWGELKYFDKPVARPCPRVGDMIDQIVSGPVIIATNHRLEKITPLLEMRQTLLRETETDELHCQLIESNYTGRVTEPEVLKIFVSELIRHDLPVEPMLTRIIQVAGYLSKFRERAYNPGFPIIGIPPRLNSLSMRERASQKEIAQFAGYIQGMVNIINERIIGEIKPQHLHAH